MFKCTPQEKDNREQQFKLEEEKLAQKNKELELKQRELDQKAEELSLTKINQEQNQTSEAYNTTELFEKYNKSVFKIFVVDKKNELYGTGTGFLIGNKGYAVTNYHVLENANSAYIELINGDIINIDPEKIVSKNKEKDFVVFKLETNKMLNGFEDYTDSPIEIGTTVFTIGNPAGGLSNTISQGIVTGQDWKDLQFSNPIDHGSSGSPLFNNRGKIIGLVWGGKHDGNLYRAVKVAHLQLSSYVDHDWSNYVENEDPNLAGPFTGESYKSNLIWSLGKTQAEALESLKSRNTKTLANVSIDGNGVLYEIDKYHDADYGQIEINFSYALSFDKREVDFTIKKHGQNLRTQKFTLLKFNKEDGMLCLVVKFDNNEFAAVLAEFDEPLFKEYGHIK
jgi:hypothetical protein